MMTQESARTGLETEAATGEAPEDKAATAVEYGIMIAAIAAVVVVTAIAVGVSVDTALFQKVFDNMASLGGGS